MESFMASRIEEERKKSLEAGQAKYRAYFLGPTTSKLYHRYQAGVDEILRKDGYEDCIVSE